MITRLALLLFDEALIAEGRRWLIITDRSRQSREGLVAQVLQERQEDGVRKWLGFTLYQYR